MRNPQLTAIIESSPNIILEWDENDAIVYSNPAAQTALKQLGLDEGGVFLPPNPAEFKERLRANPSDPIRTEVAVSGRTFSMVFCFVAKSNSLRLYGQDITQQKRTESELEQSHKLAESILKTIPLGVAIVGYDGRILFQNEVLRLALGGKNSLGQLCWQACCDDLTQCENCPLKTALTAGETNTLEVSGLMGGRTFEITHNGMTYQGQEAVLEVFVDITERKLIQEKLHRLHLEVEERVCDRTTKLTLANRELEAFTYSISHDLRSPLRSIDGFSRILLEDYADKLDAAGRQHFERIRAATQRMGRLIDDLLKFSQFTRCQITPTPVDLSALARSVTDGLRRAEPERRVDMVIEPGLCAMADAGLIEIALENLLGNAWKFTGKKDAARIELGRTTAAGGPVYFVRDNGAGFNMAYTKRLFTAFERLHGADEFPGTGIGLATVHRIIDRHHGRVWAESVIDQGTTIYFTLPDPPSNQPLINQPPQ